jgi:MoaA/NifB/PqqE/SkfB family radical SAM enzyme
MSAADRFTVATSVMMARAGLRPAPIHASLAPTWRCCLSCAYCGRFANPGIEMPVARWIGIVDELADAGCRRVSFTGGEPLMYESVQDILARCKRRGLHVSLNTNGVLLRGKLPSIARYLNKVVISLDAAREANDSVRGKGAFEAAVQAAEACAQANLRTEFYAVIGSHNWDRLGECLELAKRFGSRVSFQPGATSALGGGENPLAPTPEQMKAALRTLMKLKREGAPVANSATGLRYFTRWPEGNPVRCFGHRLFCRIEPDGAMRVCGRDPEFGVRPSVANRSAAKVFREMNKPECAACFSAARLELNLMLKPSLEAAWNLINQRL